MKQNRLFVGITGNIGSGKSSVSNYLKTRGYKIIDADDIVREIYKNDEFKALMIDNFGEYIVENSVTKELSRNKIAKIVFYDKEKLELLEKIITPFISKSFQNLKEKFSNEDLLFFDIPLLFEKGYDKEMDVNVLVFCNDEIRYNRASLRDNKTIEDIIAIDKNQIPQDEKLYLSDYTINNNATLYDLEEEVDKFLGYLGNL